MTKRRTKTTKKKATRVSRKKTAAPAACKKTAAKPGIVDWLVIQGARHHNLKDIDVEIPLGRFVCVTGVSGSGKSSLVNDILREQLAHTLNGAEKVFPGEHRTILGTEYLDKIIDIDQTPIGRTPRSNPATYVKVFDEIRKLFAKLPDSKVRGYAPGRFSFNVPTGEKGGGRCDACEGNGANRVEMDFLADVWTTCPICQGKRFNHETLQIHYRGKSIADVLEMDVQQALDHFEAIPKIHRMLSTLHDVGLDYVKLGQSSTTLSGGEAQRIKLAKELVKRSTGRTLYVLDEPTTGLHFEDIRRLLAVLHGFVNTGNTVVVIEHNLDVIKTADYVIDLGPEGGDAGGRVVATGTPEDIAACAGSHTGRSLVEVLDPKRLRTTTARGTKTPGKTRSAARDTLERVGQLASDLRITGHTEIQVVGAREHNLKDVTVSIPRGQATVCSGVSGSGKSSFALDTVYTEGQRRYVESLSAYARQFLGQLRKPKVDHVHGLSPAIAIEQKSAGNTPRSTVGTVTEIYDYMRVLWARVGRLFCPKCNVAVGTQTSEEITDAVLAMPTGTRLMLCAPIARAPGETWDALLKRCTAQGYTRIRIDGRVHQLDSAPAIDARRKHTVELVVDRIIIRDESRPRIADSIEHALALGDGVLVTVTIDKDDTDKPRRKEKTDGERRFSKHLACDTCGTSYDEVTPHHLSFNSRLGWCPSCEGLGVQHGTSEDTVISRPSRSILDGAVEGWAEANERPLLRAMLVALADAIGFDPNTPCVDLTHNQRHALLFGLGEQWITLNAAATNDRAASNIRAAGKIRAATVRERSAPTNERTPPPANQAANEPKQHNRNANLRAATVRERSAPTNKRTPLTANQAPPPIRFQWKGFFPAIDEATKNSWDYRARLHNLATEVPCQQCGGGRIRDEAKAVRLKKRSIVDVCAISLADAAQFFKTLKLDRREAKIAGELLHEIKARLQFLIDVGLGYLSLDRAAPTLSGGESQRIRLASQIGSGLTGVLYVLDEPTIGLHPRDNKRLIDALHKLRDLGNTLLMVEHDREVIEASDRIVDFGPGAGTDGGHVVATGSPAELRRKPESLTGRYLSGDAAIAVPTNRREVAHLATPTGLPLRGETGLTLSVRKARQNNLKNIDAHIPLGRFTCITGVSGSGKSSLITEILYPAVAARIHRARMTIGVHDEIIGLDHIDKVINVDQQPIGNSPSSNPATYTGVFDLLRELFARLPDSRVRGYTSNRFSFNRPGGRCDDCDGLGYVCHEMHFLPDVWVPCETCEGTRYNAETLTVRFKGKHIADVLNMRVSEALDHFSAVPKVRRLLQTLSDVGLDYLPLGQSAPTLSGGEAQRVKLASELGRPSTGKTLYILDEPTTGLHFEDLRKLLTVLHRFVDAGNTVVCIEHNLDVIKTADWVIDLGPEAGEDGGRIIAAGSPENITKVAASHTGRLIKKTLADGPHAERKIESTPEQADIAGFPDSKAATRSEPRPSGSRSGPTPKGTKPTASQSADDFGLGELGSVKLPWQVNGRRWHTEQRRSRDGKPVEWEAAALLFAVEEMEKLGKGKLLPTDWNDRGRVEIKAAAPKGLAQSAVPWFCHALTGGRWLMDLYFRVPPALFSQRTLAAKLKLKKLDDRDDIEAYGRSPRVQMRKRHDGQDSVRITVHDKKEINTPAFKTFLKEALAGYLGEVFGLAKSSKSAVPWKEDGRAWHLSQDSIPQNHEKRWKPATLAAFVGLINKAAKGLKVLWDRKVFVEVTRPDGSRVCRIITNKADFLRVDAHTPVGRFTPTQVEGLGTQQEFARKGGSGADLTFWFCNIEDLNPRILKEVIQSAAITQ